MCTLLHYFLILVFIFCFYHQRWSPRGHIFKFLALALASKPQVLEKCPLLGSRTALFFEGLKFCRSAEKYFSRPFFFWRSTEKFFKTFFVTKILAFVSLVLGLGLEHSCPWLWPRIFFCVLGLGLKPCILDSTSVYHSSNFKNGISRVVK